MNTPQEPSQLLTDLGLDSLPQAERDELNAAVGEIILVGVMRRVWDDLELDQQDALTALFEASEQDPENEEKRASIATFLDTQVPRFAEYVHDEYQELKQVQEQAQSEAL